ncbi:hypothetical protein CN878_17320 [Ochrobactrum sp. 695/2009]|nr:hypothetical protein [Brucella intermedia]PJR92006.1 hypothetical protein CN881_10520 [Ochrobactrum sp. 721/2009]PJT15066.1 hypothetical protein CN880_17325 [Ochrobactrum sp. 720/2009]PJT20099.1 hypothetical protein CN879_17185 [Ochrobactrum sp. 715/2009]PJT28068.1 hypothetical protein CN878_17320 [Ochrobactrum sp. 695/2009]PJT34531.1 hypothetical protein CN877_00005 [Ochrobactrum sp. 689/2009]
MIDVISTDIAQYAKRLFRRFCGRCEDGPSLRHMRISDGRKKWKLLAVCLGAGLVPMVAQADINGVIANVSAQALGESLTLRDSQLSSEEYKHSLAKPPILPGLSGADEVLLLNRRYGLVVDSCGVDKPAWHCSGLLMRDITVLDKQFWKLNSTEKSLQSVAYTYLRKDGSDTSMGTGSGTRMGIVLADLPTAVAVGKSYTMRCAYPVEATPNATVPNHGCNLTGITIPPNPDGDDDSSCAAVGVSTASQWKDKYLATAPAVQCSFNAQSPDSFNQSLQAYSMARPPTAGGTSVQLQMAAWDETRPETIAIEAFYYRVGDGMPLLPEAQARQLAYYQATGIWLPLLRYQPTTDTPFGYDETDQIYYGLKVVDRINARYFDTRDCPNNMAAYMCNGVVVRQTGYGAAFHSWNPSPTAIAHKGVSGSYLRIDLRAISSGVGLVFREFFAPAQHPLVMRCIYPSNANTNSRSDKCGPSGSNSLSRPCAEQGIHDLSAWRNNYNRTGASAQCSLDVDKAAFDLSMQARSTFNPIGSSETWNEAIFDIWPQNIPSQLPLEAIFYSSGQLAGAQYVQRDYFQQTSRFLPIVQLRAASGQEIPFVYILSDQVDSR